MTLTLSHIHQTIGFWLALIGRGILWQNMPDYPVMCVWFYTNSLGKGKVILALLCTIYRTSVTVQLIHPWYDMSMAPSLWSQNKTELLIWQGCNLNKSYWFKQSLPLNNHPAGRCLLTVLNGRFILLASHGGLFNLRHLFNCAHNLTFSAS